jgi:hypothetical protein
MMNHVILWVDMQDLEVLTSNYTIIQKGR